MNTKNEIIHFLKSHKQMIQDTYHISKLGLFGSFARDEATTESDVDILIELNADVQNTHDLKNALREYLSNAFGRKVDLAREKYLKTYAKDEILKDVLYV